MKTQNHRHQARQTEHSTQEYVQQRAYDLYMKRGQEPGHELEDWLEAEHQIKDEEEHRLPALAAR